MDITITAPFKTKRNGFRDSVTERLRRMFSRFSNRIARVDIALTDVNGMRGGVDKQCRVSVRMPGIGEIATTAKDESPWAAVAQATRRARRKVLTKLKRPRSQRERYRRNRWNDSDTLEEQPLD
jgi:ribosome hibernation promoting factor